MAKKRQIGGLGGDLGRLLAQAKDRAEGWISQRESIGKDLEQIRDAASALLQQLGNMAASNGRGRSRADGRPRKRRKLSAAGRAAIVAAQKARWARVRAAARK